MRNRIATFGLLLSFVGTMGCASSRGFSPSFFRSPANELPTLQDQTNVGKEPSWRGNVLYFGEDRVTNEATPILERPYRPFHFYGNTVRRQHYRNSPWPQLQDFNEMTNALLGPYTTAKPEVP